MIASCWWWGIGGLFVGGTMGFVVAALAAAAARGDEQSRATFERWLADKDLPPKPPEPPA